MTPRQLEALRLAKEIRADLLRDAFNADNRDLRGECGLASLRLARGLGDLNTLRLGLYMARERTNAWAMRGRFPNPHAWNVIDGLLIDITATQFGVRRAIFTAPVDTRDSQHYRRLAAGRKARAQIMEWGRWDPRIVELTRPLFRRQVRRETSHHESTST